MCVFYSMKPKTIKIVGIAMTLAAFGFVLIIRSYGQQAQSGSVSTTTRWSGFLVVGKTDSVDKIAGAYPAADQTVEIGLRSDGVVVWRKVAPSK